MFEVILHSLVAFFIWLEIMVYIGIPLLIAMDIWDVSKEDTKILLKPIIGPFIYLYRVTKEFFEDDE